MPYQLDLELFNRRIRDAVLWRRYQEGNVEHSAFPRSPVLKPTDQIEWASHIEWVATTQHVFDERGRLLQAVENTLDMPEDRLGNGRLLLFDPDGSLSDGAAQVASHGFFDADNIPGWDTWIFYDTDQSQPYAGSFSTFLVSWIPSSFIELVDRGIDVNPEAAWSGLSMFVRRLPWL